MITGSLSLPTNVSSPLSETLQDTSAVSDAQFQDKGIALIIRIKGAIKYRWNNKDWEQHFREIFGPSLES